MSRDRIAGVELLHSGKVRDVYIVGEELILVASDRVSVYDIVLPTPIPDKGKLLTALSLWWFDRLGDLVPNHLLSAKDVPEQFAGRAIRCRRLDMLPVECVARGYLAGSGLADYRRDGAISGVALPDGLVDGSILPEPIFTPSTKAQIGDHDAPMTFDEVAVKLGTETASQLRDITLDVYRRGRDIAAQRGIIVADTKLEFGRDSSGTLMLADEVLTSDSSRFWPAEEWEPGGPQRPFDKQYLRDWAAATGWDKTSPPPRIPDEVVAATRAKYVEAYERITGLNWES